MDDSLLRARLSLTSGRATRARAPVGEEGEMIGEIGGVGPSFGVKPKAGKCYSRELADEDEMDRLADKHVPVKQMALLKQMLEDVKRRTMETRKTVR